MSAQIVQANLVQANLKARYERTTDPKRMMTHAALNEAIRRDWKNVKEFLPARTATSIRYEKGATKAVAWDEGGQEAKIDLPLNDGWYIPDGNPFAIPNGKSSNRDDSNARYLLRDQVGEVSCSVGCSFFKDSKRSFVNVDGGYWDEGVALIGGSKEQDLLVKGVTLEAFRILVGDANASLSDLAQTVSPEKLGALTRLIQALKLE
ncbi:MAG: hypothetical protein Q7S22_06245 [Candidatus Micrarchaeota archaeon]|nr:hypothetical protein [Candidatus Micrarchaeota archaeon]